MKKLYCIFGAVAATAILSGCGSSSKDSDNSNNKPKSSTVYNWQLVHLSSETPSNLNSNCDVYAIDNSDNSKRIYAYRATQNVVVSIHSAEGVWIKELVPDANGNVSITQNDIPSGGYVTVEEIDGLIRDGKALYSYSVEKPFVNDMIFNLRKPGAYSCYNTGRKLPETIIPDNDAVVTVIAPAGKYVQSSYIDKSFTWGEVSYPNKIPVKAPIPATEKILLTQFDSYSSSEAVDLNLYAFVDGDFAHNEPSHPENKTAELKSDDLVKPGLSFTDLTLNGVSEVEVSHNNHLYVWQPIYSTSTNFSYIDGKGPFSEWAMNINGTTDVGSWSYKAMLPVNSTAKNIAPPAMTSFTADVTDLNCSGSYCVESEGYAPSGFHIQRIHVRSKTSDGSNYYQTIIGTPRKVQVLMESKHSVLSYASGDHIEIGLGELSDTRTEMIQSFMLNYIDVQNLASGNVSNHFDVNGPILHPNIEKSRKIALMGKERIILTNDVN